ncbi:class I SAM-dependent methyltransferase [Phenylobacterium sp.]|uniref:class I SAM-dependent methyltransferase n=1 Tax=Phenylobacterium sp. TaxID=1871053 RepID=UPI002C95CA19|nr:methyltransferase domain-containing protein [Phenylobacterium sp.]HLZ76338.1 methyltransferase domain-containing protein [Phenylobacterium sp.]
MGTESDPPNAEQEFARRRAVIAARATDRPRWEDPAQLEPAWDQRAARAAAYIPRGAAVLDLGCGAMALERFLPMGCRYQPCDLTARDARTLVKDFNAGEFPTGQACDIVTVLGVLEYIYDAPAFLAKLRALNVPVVMSYCLAGDRGPTDRRALGWVNDFTKDELNGLLAAAGFGRVTGAEVTPGQFLLRLEPGAGQAAPERTVWVLSYNSIGNFGDRLGGQVLSQVLPPNAQVRHVHHYPWDAPAEGAPDLLILGVGNSVFQPMLTDELLGLVDRAGRTVGIFGTQYRETIDASRLASLLDRMESWWARHEEDVGLYGGGRANIHHLGDWMIDACPMSAWTRDELFRVGDEVLDDSPLDRLIERYQSYRQFASPRMHPLLCALTAADEVGYQEQREMDDPAQVSGKFRSMFLDIFGVDKPEKQMWPVDRGAVVAYKAKVRRNVEALRAELARVLG